MLPPALGPASVEDKGLPEAIKSPARPEGFSDCHNHASSPPLDSITEVGPKPIPPTKGSAVPEPLEPTCCCRLQHYIKHHLLKAARSIRWR